MEQHQATRIALYACLRKKPRTLEDAEAAAEASDIYYYCCPFSQLEYHYHLTQGRNSRSWGKIRRAAQVLGCLGPCPDEL